MINFFKIWCENIIVVVIVCIIIEMILPENKNKKYVQVVMGIYIVFTILNPIITKINANDININKIFDLKNNTEEVFKKEYNNENIQKIYLDAIKNDIKNEISILGFNVDNIKIETDFKNTKIDKIIVYIDNINAKINNSIYINEIKIDLSESKNENKEVLTENDKQIIKNKILEMYEIEKENIEIY